MLRPPDAHPRTKKNRAEKIARYVFFGAMITAVIAVIIQLLTRNGILAVRIFITAFWLAIAFSNGVTFYSGSFRWHNGPTFTREQSPILFYASAIFFTLGSMSLATLLLWKAYITE